MSKSVPVFYPPDRSTHPPLPLTKGAFFARCSLAMNNQELSSLRRSESLAQRFSAQLSENVKEYSTEPVSNEFLYQYREGPRGLRLPPAYAYLVNRDHDHRMEQFRRQFVQVMAEEMKENSLSPNYDVFRVYGDRLCNLDIAMPDANDELRRAIAIYHLEAEILRDKGDTRIVAKRIAHSIVVMEMEAARERQDSTASPSQP